jgi:hypothetical protein
VKVLCITWCGSKFSSPVVLFLLSNKLLISCWTASSPQVLKDWWSCNQLNVQNESVHVHVPSCDQFLDFSSCFCHFDWKDCFCWDGIIIDLLNGCISSCGITVDMNYL